MTDARQRRRPTGPSRWLPAFSGGAALVAAAAASAQTVALGGSFGDKALLVIDGTPRSVGVGATSGGVRLVSLSGGEAVVEVKGKRFTVSIGASPVNLGGAATGGTGSRIVLTADSGGHFFGSGTINGKYARFLVDTGATQVSLGQADADRLGLDYRSGQRGYSQTANGPVPVYRVSLAQVQVGDVRLYDVDATVLPASMGHVLLGNSFLTRFQMHRDNDTLTLERRF